MRKSALRASGAVDEPNVILALASSYNERGVQGYTHTITNSEDQRKINCLYEIARNSATGKGTLTLSKRPGVTINSNTYGISGQIAYLAIEINSAVTPLNTFLTVFAHDNTLLLSRSSTSAHTVTINALGNTFIPAYVDSTFLSGTKNIVIQLYKYDTDTPHGGYFITASDLEAGNAWTQILDGDFIGVQHRGKMEHLDGYAFIMESTGKIINSDINSLANWTATSFITKGIQQDVPMGLARLGTRIIAFSAESAEVFYNAGNTVGSPLGRITQLAANIGLVPTVRQAASRALAGGTHYYATIGTKIYFVGRESGKSDSIGVYTFDGSAFIKVSSVYIDKIISEKSAVIYSVNTIGFLGQSAVAICFSAPSESTQRFLVYSPVWNEWFEWNSTVFSPVNGSGYHLGMIPNKLYGFSMSDNWQDAGTSYPWSTQFKLPTNGSSTKFMPMYGVDADTDTSTNDLTVEISTTDPQTFTTLGTIDQTQDRKVLFEGGSFTKAWIRLGNTNARPTRIHNWLCRIE